MTTRSRALLLVTGLVVLLCPAAASIRAGQDENVARAIDTGVDFLLKCIEENIVEGDPANGRIALETYALLVAGVSVDHPLIQRSMERLSKMQLNHTYTVSCYAFALDAAISQIHADMQFLRGRLIPDGPTIGREYRDQLEKAINALVQMKHKDHGRWNYGPDREGKRYDNSNTQFAVLALGLAPKRRVTISPKVWEQIALHFVSGQQEKGPKVDERIELLPADERGEDRRNQVKIVEREAPGETRAERTNGGEPRPRERGRTTVSKVDKAVPEFGDEGVEVQARGWSYVDDKEHGGYKWNMTCAGLSSLILAAENLRTTIPGTFRSKINRAIRDGYGWLMKHWNIPVGGGGWNYYGIYSLEKVGDLGGVKKFGSHDWYDEVATAVVGEQLEDGGWPGDNMSKRRENTSFALLVLNRATSLLTQRANRMVTTGPGAHSADTSDRDNWVYIQSMDREIHIPSVVRMIRLRPNPKVLQFVELIVDNYPPERNGFLVPKLVQLLRSAENPNVKKYFLDNLRKITGAEYEDVEKYLVWHRRWAHVSEAGELVQKDQIPYLLKYYENTESSVPLRRKVIWALARCRAVEAAPRFVEDLNHPDEAVRTAAYEALTVLPLGKAPPRFDPSESNARRDEQARAVAAWFDEVRQ